MRIMQKALEKLQALQETLHAYVHATEQLTADMQSYAPAAAGPYIGKTVGILNREANRLFMTTENGELLDDLWKHQAELDDRRLAEVKKLRKKYHRQKLTPPDLSLELDQVKNQAMTAWLEAKRTDDFSVFQPYLEKQVQLKRQLHALYDPEGMYECYDFWLNEFSPGLNSERCDSFFSLVRQELVPLMRKCEERSIDTAFLHQKFSVENQRKTAKWLLKCMLPCTDRWALGEVEHPFGGGVNNHDLRIYTRFCEDNFLGAIYAIMHEGGHCIQSMLQPDWCNDSILLDVPGDVGESQSRFQENIIGKSREWVRFMFPKLAELFPEQLRGISAEDFWRAVNVVEPCENRQGSGEAVYLFQIILRYEIEKMLIRGELAAADVPAEWARLQKEYIGIGVSCNANGCLQDIHWAMGLIGYFPSYALGSAYGAQLLYAMEKEIPDLWRQVEQGNLLSEVTFLEKHIYTRGNVYDIDRLLTDATGEPFHPRYYISYLKEKLQAVYQL